MSIASSRLPFFGIPLSLSSRELGAVVAVARCGSFIAAAAELKISQPALTRMIQQTEAGLGLKLFDRTTRRVTVTQAGTEFVAMAERILNDLAVSLRSLRDHNQGERGRLSLSSVMSFAYGRLPLLISEFRSAYAGVEIHLREGIYSDVHEDVRRGLVDLGIAYGNLQGQDPGIEEVLIAEPDTLSVIVPEGHRLAAKSQIELADLHNEPMISVPHGAELRRTIDGFAAKAGVHINVVATVTHFATIFRLVRCGVGIGIVPSATRGGLSEPSIVWCTLNAKSLGRPLCILRSRSRELSSIAQAFISVVNKTK